MISWPEYLSEFVDCYRQLYEKIPRDLAKVFHKKLSVSFTKPCQIEVIEFGQDRNIWLIIYDKTHKDKEFFVSVISESEVSDFARTLIKKYPSLKRKTRKISGYLKDKITSKDIASKRRHKDICDHLGAIYANFEVRVISPRLRAGDILDFGMQKAREARDKERLKRTTNKLKRQIAKVPERDIKSELLKTLKRLDEQQSALSNFGEEIEGVRKLVGTTREFQDWKVLVSDVDKLKIEHVSKEVFNERVDRLNEKMENGLENLEKRIDKGLEALNTRIEDLKAIKFWSKRTLLEMALAIIATIATLYAAGIIKF